MSAVVLFHVVLWHYTTMLAVVPDAVADPLMTLNSVLGSVRMPVLLAVSGLVLARRVRSGPLRTATASRAVGNYYLYVVWLVVYAFVYGVVLREPSLPHRVDGVAEVFAQLVVPDTTLWYLLALAVYIPILTLVRNAPPWLVLTAVTILSVAAHIAPIAGGLWIKIPELAVFFAVGVYGADLLRAAARSATAPRLAAAFAVAVIVTVGGGRLDSPFAVGVVFVLRGVSFTVLAVTAVAIAVRWAPVRRVGVYLGRQTLAVYVMHPLLIGAILVGAGPNGERLQPSIRWPWAAAVYPFVVTALIIAVSLLLHALALRVGLHWLFALPSSWSQALSAPAVRSQPPSAHGRPTDGGGDAIASPSSSTPKDP